MVERASSRLSLVVLTHNRCEEVLRTLRFLQASAPGVPLIVVDNASTDDTVRRIRRQFPRVHLVCACANLGAAGRNLGVRAASTEYVAFCDDDVCWLPDALPRAQALLDRHPDVAVLSARVLVGPSAALDAACALMAASPLAGEPDVGPALTGFLAGACVFRSVAFRQAGGYWPALFLGGEESLLALELLERDWRILYAPDIVARHWPSKRRDASERRRLLARNALLVAWMRLPWKAALQEAWASLIGLPGWRARWTAIEDALRHERATGARRRPVSARVAGQRSKVRRAQRCSARLSRPPSR
ncbi:glycosyltransferase family 2 protein [Castellaniella ginsengisoli]|uniref:Glycosyltransferase n=1 Tax=Castellaniella ginsengisoli TaxID=546114 RepID=A0AB39CHT9_9BURK